MASPPAAPDQWRAAALAFGVERLSDRVRRYRHLSLAGDPSLPRMGPADLLQPIHLSAARHRQHLAGAGRAGPVRRLAAAPDAARDRTTLFPLVGPGHRRRPRPWRLAAVPCLHSDAGPFHALAGAG